MREGLVNDTLAGRLVGPVVFLCSDAASYVRGAILPVNGGLLGI